jgi:hypothetical protein
MTRKVTHLLLAVVVVMGLNSCRRADADARGATHIFRVQGFSGPESVKFDPKQDIYFVSNIVGFGSEKDGNGRISIIDAANPRKAYDFIVGGKNGAVLDAPKGMAIQGDTLWVADIHNLRGFHRKTGAPVGDIDFHPHDPVMLNDIALGPDGALYVTDTGIIMSRVGVSYQRGSKVFKVANRQISMFAADEGLSHPNGIVWDSAGDRWIIVTFHPAQSELYTLGSGNQKRTLFRGLGRMDGVESLQDGRYVFTSWSDYSVQLLENGRSTRIVNNVWQPADLGYDSKRNRIMVPTVLQGRVDIWELPPK